MRLKVALILIIMLGITAIASAKEKSLDDPLEPLTPISQPQAWLQANDGTMEPVLLEPIDPAVVPQSPTAGSGSDQCLQLTPALGIGDTGATPVNSFTVYDESDPILSCRWSFPDKGFRTVWYRLKADSTTLLVIDTVGSNYDTILGVHSVGDPTDACATLTELACNDDFNRFTSRVSVPVRAGDTYYIQVGDYHAGNPTNNKIMYVTALPTPLSSNWQVVASDPANTAAQRSRHVALSVGDKVYIIAGQFGVGNNLIRTPSSVVYNTSESDPARAWKNLQSMTAADGFGFSNTTAAYVSGRIYIPSGFIGVDGAYDGSHHVYDISQNRWDISQPSSNSWADGFPSIFATAVPYRWLGLDGYFLMGGLTGPIPGPDTIGFEARTEMYFYQVPSGASGDLWFRLPAVLNRGRFGHVAAEQRLNGADQICVAGGFGKEVSPQFPELARRELLSSTECYHINDGNWVTLNTAELNYPRAYAGSSVNAAGDWYIYGGFDGDDRAVSAVEWFNRETQEWRVLDVRFDLGAINLHDPNQQARPPRLWPRGGFVDNDLWVFGGETVNPGIVNLIEQTFLKNTPEPITPQTVWLPNIFHDAAADIKTDDTFATAVQLRLNQPQVNRFDGENDFVDVFFFDVPSYRQITMRVSQLPVSSDYELQLFNVQKSARLPIARNIGQTSLVETRGLEQGRYYIVLQRNAPPPQNDPSPPPYIIEVQG